MKIKGKDPETGETLEVEAPAVDNHFIKSMVDFKMSDNEVKKSLDNLNISADAKSILYSISKATIQAGKFVIKIGRKIIDFVCLVLKEYPSTSFGIIFGAIVGFLISSIPIIGWVIGPMFAAITIALGVGIGYFQDIQDHNLARKIQEIHASFIPLNAQ